MLLTWTSWTHVLKTFFYLDDVDAENQNIFYMDALDCVPKKKIIVGGKCLKYKGWTICYICQHA